MTGKVSQGVTLGYGDGASPEGFTTIPGAVDLQLPGFETAEIDMSSLADALGSFEPGKPKIQAVSGTINFDPDEAAQIQLLTDVKARTKRNFQITITDTSPDTEVTFNAFVQTWGPVGISADDKLSLPFTLRPTQDVTFADA